ncbi:MAG: hypothetical protein OEY13_01985 [Gammaproteobacteria bacterium]|nr:hypothetical protein [Gammaproteobacteria bacterium]MDH4311775.1 hypothetical protein [Gammaproteobacteria bacterium]MDH5271824.1 hypothetical protein [Gammaproteobacteria bacterium]
MPRSLSCGAPRWYRPGIACNDEALADLQRQWFLWPMHDPREIDPGAARGGG